MEVDSSPEYLIIFNDSINLSFPAGDDREPCQLINSERNRILAVVFAIIFCLSVVGNCL
ncbi:unnamed protein product, partial [Soboliphyme baturini]|uniref:G_PROTEIN_RECEP_F1_2 domain-containing protein n=1 Tax=Soboliphyme baturini TaxID=241478 RepID=A0A183JA82_9BILA